MTLNPWSRFKDWLDNSYEAFLKALDLQPANDEQTQRLVRLYVIGATRTLHEVADFLEQHPEYEPVDYIRAVADRICFNRPDVIEYLESSS